MQPKRLLIKALCTVLPLLSLGMPAMARDPGLWQVYNDTFKSAKYVDLTHMIIPDIPVWAGFGNSTFSPAESGADMAEEPWTPFSIRPPQKEDRQWQKMATP